MSTEDPRRTFLLEFNRIYRKWSRSNLGRKALYDLAIKGAEEKVKLPPQQRAEVDSYLAGKIEMRRPTIVDGKSIDVDGR